jgi:hypothetical protein
MSDDVLCHRFITGMANITMRMHAMSPRTKSVTPFTTVELQNFLNRLVVDSPHFGRAQHPQDAIVGNGNCRGSRKRPINNGGGNGTGNGSKKLHPAEHDDGT